MATLTPTQIVLLAKGAGFTGDGLAWAVAVALAESSGRTDAINTNSDKSLDRGLWQINSKAHPEVTSAQAMDPASAAAAAYRISSGGKNWSQWVAYTNGAASRELSRARAAVAQVAAGTAPGSGSAGDPNRDPAIPGDLGALLAAPGDAIAALSSLAKSTAAVASTWIKTAEWLATPHNWVRVMEVGGGLVLVTVAIIMLGRSGAGPVADSIKAATAAPARAVKAASNVIPAGKATKLLK